MVSGPFTDNSLPHLKKLFAREVKRNLFEAFLQPRRTLVSLISTTTTSSAAFPGGEAFDFCFSPNGHWVLALSSSRIYVIDTVSPTISVQRELKVLRRPVSAAILDDGSTLAVLSVDHQVNVYDLTDLKVKHVRGVSLDNPPHAIALAPKGEVLAAAFDGGIEVHSLVPDAVGLDHRAIKCDRVDALIFSSDGTMLLGTTRTSRSPNTVILSAPYYTEEQQELPVSEQISHLWTTQILFPNSSRDCSNATLLPNRSDGDANWTFTYDKVFESFRAVRTDDLRNGTTYFTGPKPPIRDGPRSTRRKLTPCTLPASSDHGELVAAGFLDKEVWLYGVPEGLDTSCVSQTDDPNSQTGSSAGPSTPLSDPKSPARDFTRGEAAEVAKLPNWQVLVDKYRNVFAKGRRVAEISGVSGVCWVSRKHERSEPQPLGERLVIAAPGGIAGESELEQDGFASVDGGRLVILDFDRTADDGMVKEITFEVGNDTPELLEEANMDMDTEVALVRQRTVKREASTRAAVVDVLASAPPIPLMPSLAPTANAIANSHAAVARDPIAVIQTGPMPQEATMEASPASPTGEDLSLEEASEAFDGPYSHTQPRSRTSLYRSATAVAANRQRNPQRPRIIDEGGLRFRRPGDRTELPHESDADNWVPPPPPYTAKSDRPLPEELRMTLLPRTIQELPTQRARPAVGRDRPRRARTVYEDHTPTTASRRISSFPSRPPLPLRQRSSDASAPSNQSRRSASDTRSQLSGAVSPLSAAGFSFGDEPSVMSQRPSTSTGRRPMSAFVGRMTSSLRRPNASDLPRLEPQPPMPQRPVQAQSVSLPPSPAHNRDSPTSPLTLSGGNLQQRLEYPLPPAPTNSSVESLNRRYTTTAAAPTPTRSDASAYQQHVQDLSSIAAGMPSAQQLANLQTRSRQPPTSHPQLPGLVTQGGYPIPAPPRGALGAAGSPTSAPLHSPSRSLSNKNSFARSSPALLRPTPRRLDTIESVSSFISRPGTRSGQRSRSRDLTSAHSGSHVRSQSVGPVPRLDRVPTDGAQKKSLFGGKRKKVKGRNEHHPNDAFEGDAHSRGSKCLMM